MREEGKDVPQENIDHLTRGTLGLQMHATISGFSYCLGFQAHVLIPMW